MDYTVQYRTNYADGDPWFDCLGHTNLSLETAREICDELMIQAICQYRIVRRVVTETVIPLHEHLNSHTRTRTMFCNLPECNTGLDYHDGYCSDGCHQAARYRADALALYDYLVFVGTVGEIQMPSLNHDYTVHEPAP